MPPNSRLPTLDDDRVVFAGAYHGWGFHEDGAASGLRAARRLGADMARGRPGDMEALRVLTPALYRTRITHLRRAPVHHYFEHRELQLVRRHRRLAAAAAVAAALSPGSMPRDHSRRCSRTTTLRQRIDAFLADRGIDLRGGTVTALLQARVLGYVFNPLSLYWCHDADGVLRHVDRRGAQHLRRPPRLPAAADDGRPAMVMKKLYVSPFNDVDGLLPGAGATAGRRPGRDDLAAPRQPARIRRDDARQPAARRPSAQLVRLQLVAPLAPLMGALGIRIQGITLWLRRVPVVPRPHVTEKERVDQL